MKTAVALSLALSSVVGAENLTPKITYYSGSVVYLAPAGDKHFGATTSLVKRTVRPETIEERVLQPARKPGEAPVEYVTTMTRVRTTTTYTASDEKKTFSGTIVFDRPDAWTYHIVLADGTKLEGTGTLAPAQLSTRKVLLDKAGTPTMRVQEDLHTVDAAHYEALRQQLLGK